MGTQRGHSSISNSPSGVEGPDNVWRHEKWIEITVRIQPAADPTARAPAATNTVATVTAALWWYKLIYEKPKKS